MAKIKTIRIVQGNDNSYSMTVIVEGDSTNTVNDVKCTFGAWGDNPSPSPTLVPCAYQSKATNGDKTYGYDTLTFSSNAVGVTYSVRATMYNSKGGTLGSDTQNVTVAAQTKVGV